jgi:hypothetical protein
MEAKAEEFLKWITDHWSVESFLWAFSGEFFSIAKVDANLVKAGYKHKEKHS